MSWVAAAIATTVIAATAAPASGQGTVKVGAVNIERIIDTTAIVGQNRAVDVSRLKSDSKRVQAMLVPLQEFQTAEFQKLKAMNDEIVELQKRFQEGRLSLAEDKLGELGAQIEEKTTQFERAREDVEKQLRRRLNEDLAKVQEEVFEVIGTVGKEGGYTLVFNKFQGALVYADDSVDITDLVIQRLDANAGGE